MGIFDKVYRYITRGRSPATEGRRGLPEMIRQQEIKHGSGRAAARAWGIPESTWRSWRNGRPAKAKHSTVIDALKAEHVKTERRARLSPGREKKLRAGTAAPGPLHAQFGDVTGTLIISSDERTRSIDLSQWITPESEQAIVDAYLSGRDGAVEQAIKDAMDDYVPGVWSDLEVEFDGQHHHID